MDRVRDALTPTSKNAPDAGQGVEGMNQNPYLGDPMRDIVDQATDKNEPVDLDADLTEFEKYAREFMPEVSPKSTYYRLEERAHSYSTWVPFDKVIDTVAPGLATPVWHNPDSADEFWSRTPARNGFVGSENLVRMSRAAGVKDEIGITFPSFAARLAQGANMREPIVETWVVCATSGDGEVPTLRWQKNSRMNLTLDEATEIASLLMLLVDVARDSAGQGGER